MRDTTLVPGAFLLCFLFLQSCAFDLGLRADDADVIPESGDVGLDGDDDADIDRTPPPSGDWPEADPARTGLDGDVTTLYGEFETCFDQGGAVGACLDTLEAEPGERCCRETSHGWIDGDFPNCVDLATCGWSTFAGLEDGDAVHLTDGTVWLGGDGVGEVGLYSLPVADTTGEPLVSFTAALSEIGCTEESCRQAFGAALTEQETLRSGTSVVPFVGIVLDGELSAINLYVAGRVEQRVPITRETLTTHRGYGYQVRRDGTVAFWLSFDARVMPTPAELEARTPDYLSTPTANRGGVQLRLALFGRLTGERAAQVGSVQLERDVCDVVGGFRHEPRAVRSAIRTGDRAGRPAVIAIPDSETAPGGDEPPATMLMVFETAGDLAVATSCQGADWRFLGPAMTDPPLQYGRTARRAPALAYWSGGYHLWYEAVTEREQNRTVIVHAMSADGLVWTREEDDVALDAERLGDAANEVGDPTVVALTDGRLAMWFVARNALGEGTIRRASSDDGKEWNIDETPISFEPSTPAGFERDGIEQPVVVLRGARLHMWYAGRDGARRAIGAAVALDPSGLQWRRLGLALDTRNVWETPGVGGPAVLTLPGPAAEIGLLHLWYEAGGSGRERIGLARREIPIRH